jgi:hypothetical protein
VKLFLPPVLVASLLLFSAGCGYVSIRGAIEPGSMIQGVVTGIQLGNVVNGTGGMAQVTTVTFLQTSTSINIGFCGDQTGLFQLQQTEGVNFNPGPLCATVIVVTIVG